MLASFRKLWAEHKLTIASHEESGGDSASAKDINPPFMLKKFRRIMAEHTGIGSIPADQKLYIDNDERKEFPKATPFGNVMRGKLSKFRALMSAHKLTREDMKINYGLSAKHEAVSELMKGIREEASEHGMDRPTAKKTALDHLAKDPLYYSHLKEMENKYKRMKHGTELPLKVAHHSSIGMDDYAQIDVAFLKEGDWHTGGVAYHYPWEVIKRDAKTFEGRDFYLNHIEDAGVEYGIIDKVYPIEIDGEEWMAASVHIPEKPFTANLLDRMETGLAQNVSSTHEFIVDPRDETRTVKQLQGRAISLVKDPEVEGAKILSVKRKLKGKKKKDAMRKEIAKRWRK